MVKAGESSDELMPFYLTLKEYNAYYFQASTLDTKIKHEALQIFNSTKSGIELTDMQRYWMKHGLSSILDLVNPNSTQAFLRCEEQDWHRVETKFILRHRISFEG